MTKCQAFSCSVQAENIGSDCGLRLRNDGSDCGSEYKMCSETIVPRSDQEYPFHATLNPGLFVTREPVNTGCLVLSDDLVCLNAEYQHQAINTNSRKFKCFIHFEHINAMPVTIKARLECAYVLNYTLHGGLLAFPNLLVRVFNETFLDRPASFWGDQAINYQINAWLCSGEASRYPEIYD